MIGNGHDFKCGRQLAAWLGLTPGQYSSGGKTRLERITKASDPWLRTLLILGSRALLNAARNKTDSLSRWAVAPAVQQELSNAWLKAQGLVASKTCGARRRTTPTERLRRAS